jgi:APA family basic amino acid/polyamine antiporter
MVGTLLAAAIYIISTIGVMSLVPPATLATTTAPFADGARTLFGNTAAGLVALAAAISCFGALNGWTLVVGQLPLAVARDGLFPAVFSRVSSRETPVTGMVIAGELFTFIILLATLSTLIPYVFCALAVFRIGGHAPVVARAVAGVGFAYGLWAIGGAGAETVYWGFLLLLLGLPVFVWVTRPRARAHV